MTYPQPITLDQCGGVHPEITFNEVAAALAKAALFGVNQRLTVGLNFAIWGGNLAVSGAAVIAVPNQQLVLTPSTTNYIYADGSGTAHLVTSAPSGWPGPLASGRALYQLVVGTDAITSGTCWNVCAGQGGTTGGVGPSGAAGAEVWLTRKRVHMVNSFSDNSTSDFAFVTQNVGGGGSPGAWPPDSTTFIGQIVQDTYGAGTTAANSSGGRRSSLNHWTLGNAAGRGGFDVTLRFGCTATSAHTRCFAGLFDVSGGDPSATVDPSSLVNMIGVGLDDGDTNLSTMWNDGSGAATKTTLGSNFPGRGASSPNKAYELRIWALANGSVINYSITDPETGNNATGSASSNIPANTDFLGWVIYVNTGAGGSNVQIKVMQVAGSTRY